MENWSLPRLEAGELKAPKRSAWGILQFLICETRLVIYKNTQRGLPAKPSPAQGILLDLDVFDNELGLGGFLKLILSGYGRHAFSGHFTRTLGSWGARKLEGIFIEAGLLYHKHEHLLEDVAFSDKHHGILPKLDEFESLDQRYSRGKAREAMILKKHIEDNIEQFAIIIPNT
jgi:hypothetical protein